MINRVYSPILEISYRPRWPRGSNFTTSELLSLIDPEKRNEVKRNLMQRQRSKSELRIKLKPLPDYYKRDDNEET